MPYIRWATIAKYCLKMYIEGRRCKLCGETLDLPETAPVPKKLYFVYRHFKEKHPDIVNDLKNRLKQRSQTAPNYAIYFT